MPTRPLWNPSGGGQRTAPQWCLTQKGCPLDPKKDAHSTLTGMPTRPRPPGVLGSDQWQANMGLVPTMMGAAAEL